ncbi:hypothetical protein HPP92_006149 [Vanilla planifolia]|uniref:Uncharacterized protein n=1 Tax=Vanilla planifolia TaxID=51239 RepID=A0A835RMP9_VANPL|nr:hypothetical protein HPP92_006149 [Vanilla planifolia]
MYVELIVGKFSWKIDAQRVLSVVTSLQDLINGFWLQADKYGVKWKVSRDKMKLLYVQALSSNSVLLLNSIQLIQDELLLDEIEKHKASSGYLMPLPLQKFLETLKLLNAKSIDYEANLCMAIRSCMIDLYHYARLSGAHILERVIDSALLAVKREQIQVASDVLLLFPRLRPLVAVLGWDLLVGKPAARRKLMQLLWTTKSQLIKLEEFPMYKKNDEVSCVEYLCDLLCFHLDLASFVACMNSGRPWNSKASLLFSQREQASDASDDVLDTFVENFILERLCPDSMRVLFDVVPGIKFQDAIEVISLQPIASTADALKRMQDIELMHMCYGLESVVLALGAMEECLVDETENDDHFLLAIYYLKDMQNHLDAIKNVPRKIFVVCIICSLLHVDNISVIPTQVVASSSYPISHDQADLIDLSEVGNKGLSFTGILLDILRHNLSNTGLEADNMINSDVSSIGRQALEWRICHAKTFIEDWEWRLSILRRVKPSLHRTWGWKEALVILRAAPAKLLNFCIQRAQYDIGEEAVCRFSLPAEDKAALGLAEWVAGAFRSSSVEDVATLVAEGTLSVVQDLDFSTLRAQLGSLDATLLCIDVAVASSKSVDVCKVLLGQARDVLSEIYPGRSPKFGPSYWDQIQELAIISVARRVLQRLHNLVEQVTFFFLQELFIEGMDDFSANGTSRHGQRQRTLVILNQMIDDAHKGKRQFLSGKLHNLARAVTDEDSDGNFLKGDGVYPGKRTLSYEKGVVLGLGLKILKPAATSTTIAESISEISGYDVKDTGKRFLGSLASKPQTYLSAFIIYIATVGDIVDGIDTTHDFNFFSLVYEWPKDLLIRLVFERGSTDAAEKVADIMCVDFVHEVISACVPPVFPPRSGHGWACVPLLPTISSMNLEKKVSLASGSLHDSSPHISFNPLYPLQLNVVKHLAKLSPVRAVLACVFGCNILSTGSESCASSSLSDTLFQAPDEERLFHEFAL